MGDGLAVDGDPDFVVAVAIFDEEDVLPGLAGGERAFTRCGSAAASATAAASSAARGSGRGSGADRAGQLLGGGGRRCGSRGSGGRKRDDIVDGIEVGERGVIPQKAKALAG